MSSEGRGYLDGLPSDVADRLVETNRSGLAALRRYLASGQAVAFLGAGTSAPLYPGWGDQIRALIDAAVDHGLPEPAAAACRVEAAGRPDTVVEIVRQQLGAVAFQGLLREVYRVRRDPTTGRTWTPVQELICRSTFKAVVTTNYDPGIVDARMRVRPRALSTGFATWQDERRLDDWRTGDVFGGEDDLPVLYAHGQHNQPESIVLATTDYRRAYAGKLSPVIARMIDAWHLVWIGFSFSDQRISAILREVREGTGSESQPGVPPRHVAVMPYDPAGGRDPMVLADLVRIEFGADLVLYPASGDDHSALGHVLADFAEYPPVPALTTAEPVRVVASPVTWTHGVEAERSFVGRAEELSKLDRWAEDPTVRLVGVTAWGGAGKTALVAHWVDQLDGARHRPGARGTFGWSFYANPSADDWAEALLRWVRDKFGLAVSTRERSAAILELLRAVPMVLVLDGLEVLQEGPTGADRRFGALLDGGLRQVLTGVALRDHPSLAILTSRFPFADLVGFDGGAVRMLDLPPLTPAEGGALLAARGASRLSQHDLRKLAQAVDGHALALTALSALLTRNTADVTPTSVTDLLADLDQAGSTGRRVSRVLEFYAQRLDEPHRLLVGAVGLFSRPVTAKQLLGLTVHPLFAPLTGWTEAMIRAAVKGPLAGLLSWRPDQTISAHPIVRQVFRPLVLGAAEAVVTEALTDMPGTGVTDRNQALRIVEAIELLLDADKWVAADNLVRTRTDDGAVWADLPAVQLGQRAAAAFVGTAERRQSCARWLGPSRLGVYVSQVGLFSMYAGDLATAREYLPTAIRDARNAKDNRQLSLSLGDWSECLVLLGRARDAMTSAAEGLDILADAADPELERTLRTILGWAAHLAGDGALAERQFELASESHLADDPAISRIGGLPAVRWGQVLHDTGRTARSRRLAEANLRLSQRRGWTLSTAQSQLLLARLDLTDGSPSTAGPLLAQAISVFREGDYLVPLADALVVAGEQARQVGALDDADMILDEAIAIAGPRGLHPILSGALSARARMIADRYTRTADPRFLANGRDAADAALRSMTTGSNPLPWGELDACRAHAHLDKAEGIDHGWGRRVESLYYRLVERPPSLPVAVTLNDVPLSEPRNDLAPIAFGLATAPGRESSRPAVFDLTAPAHHLLVTGDPGSGRSQLLRTLAGAVAQHYGLGDLHLYAVDCGDGGLLKPIADLPHCGAVATDAEALRLMRLFNRLTADLRRRQELLADGGFANITEQRLGASVSSRLPHILVLVDGLERFRKNLAHIYEGKLNEQLMALVRHGGPVGIHVAAAGEPQLLRDKSLVARAETLVLRTTDQAALAAVRIQDHELPRPWIPGHALRPGNREVRVAQLDGGSSAEGQALALATLATTAWLREAAVSVGQRPFRVDETPLIADQFHVGDAQGRPVGREDVLAWLLSRHATRTSAALLGPRRAGKSWVLGELHRRLGDSGSQSVRRVTVPMPSGPGTLADLVRLLDPKVARRASPSAALLKKAEQQAATADPLVFLLDEVGRLANYDPSAVSWLRDLGQAGAWLVYTGTEKDWRTVVRWALGSPGSSFGNDVNAWELGPWEQHTAISFVSGTAANLGVDLPADTTGRAITALVGTWPFYLQVIGDATVREVQSGNLDVLSDGDCLAKLVERRLIDEWTSHFEGRWAEVGPAGRAVLIGSADAPPGSLNPSQRNDLRECGILRIGDEWLIDPPFYRWIKRNCAALSDRESRA